MHRSTHFCSVISVADAFAVNVLKPVAEPKQPRKAYPSMVAGSRSGTSGSVDGLGGAVETAADGRVVEMSAVLLWLMVAGFGTVVKTVDVVLTVVVVVGSGVLVVVLPRPSW